MKSIQQIIEEQVQRWQVLTREKKVLPAKRSVISISREPGSGGRIIATELANKLGFDLFHQEVLHQMAQSAHVDTRLVETLDEKGLNLLEETISSVVNEHHLWPDEYLKHLMKVVGVIGEHGRCVLVGRGANFILPRERCLRVRVVAPLAVRVKRVCTEFGLSPEDAKRRVIRTESDRRAFVRKYFYADVSDPLNYDMIVNTEYLSISDAVESIRCVVEA
ncbi:MAG: cytidylate kinase-like family protein [Pseudomonadota bacterium]